MKKFDIEAKRDGNIVTFSIKGTVMGHEVNKLKLHDNDAAQLTLNIQFDAKKLAKFIEKTDGSSGDKAGPGWAERIAEGVLTEGLKDVVKVIIGNLS